MKGGEFRDAVESRANAKRDWLGEGKARAVALGLRERYWKRTTGEPLWLINSGEFAQWWWRL